MHGYQKAIRNSKYLLKWLFAAAIIGAAGGIGAFGLKTSISFIERISSKLPLWLAPAAGGIIVSIFLLWDYNAAGNGTDSFINAVNKFDGRIPFKMGISKLIATAATLGFHGSGGLEGPVLVTGGAIGNSLAGIPFTRDLFKTKSKLLTICGAAGALGAIFHSPLGGGIFVVELVSHSSLHYAYLFPAVLSSTMGYVAFGSLMGGAPMFQIPSYLPNISDLPWFVAAGILGGLLALLFIYSFRYIDKYFKKISCRFLRPVIGGILTGIVLLFRPEVAGTGLALIQQLIFDSGVIETAIIVLLLAKILATCFTVGSGQSAGLVIPSLFIGSLGGMLIAAVVGGLPPQLYASLIVACMTAVLAGTANVPIAAAVMLSEMAGLAAAVPAAVGSVVGYAVAHSQVIYSEAVDVSDMNSIDTSSEVH